MGDGRGTRRGDARGPDEIEQDLEETREKLADDLDALSRRLSPEHLKYEALGTVDAAREAATEQVERLATGVGERASAVADRLVDGVRSSRMPLPLVFGALGAGYVLMQAGRERDGRAPGSRSARYGTDAEASFLRKNGLAFGLGAVAVGAVVGTVLSMEPETAERRRRRVRRAGRRIGDAAAGYLERLPVARAGGGDAGIQVRERVRVNASSEELYRFWRDLENLPRLMRHLEKVTVEDRRRSHWVAKGPAGRNVEWDAVITDDRPNDAIAWRSVAGSDVPNEGAVKFLRVGPNATDVIVSLTVRPPGGKLGGVVAKLFGEEPSHQVADDLERFKEEMESGRLLSTSGSTTAGTAVVAPAGADRG